MIDEYTGKRLDDDNQQDHVVSAREVHEDRGRVLAGIPTNDLANKQENLKQTHRCINREKSDKSVSQFLDDLDKNIDAVSKQLDNLNNKSNLNENQLRQKSQLEKRLGNYSVSHFCLQYVEMLG